VRAFDLRRHGRDTEGVTRRIEEHKPSRIWLVRSFRGPRCHRKRNRSLKVTEIPSLVIVD